ncbi:MAG TPA: hypothetical protein P5096_03130 [Patescibacteria group bacterium]|nr:hypothetical protein [Patescibacteria group bacterium]
MKKLFMLFVFGLLFVSAKAFAYNEADATAFYRVMPSLVQYYSIPDGGSKIVFGNLNVLNGKACVGVKQYVFRDMLSGNHISLSAKLGSRVDATIYTMSLQVTGGPTVITHTTAVDYHANGAGIGVLMPLQKGGTVRVTGRYSPKALTSLTVFSTMDVKKSANDSIIGFSYAGKKLPLVEVSRSKNHTTDIRMTGAIVTDGFIFNVGPYFQKRKGDSLETGFMVGVIPTK